MFEDVHQTPLPATTESAGGFMAIIEKLTTNPTLQSVEVIERMMAAQERWEAREAEKSFNQAMERLQMKLPRIVKNSQGHNSKYAKLEDIDEVVRPLMKEEGFSVSYTTEPRATGGCITVGTLRHAAGHKITSQMEMPLDGVGNKGMNSLQGMGSSNSYGKRYVLCNLLNIVTVGDDDDGRGSGGSIDEDQIADIEKLIKDAGADRAKFLAFLGVQQIEDIRLADYAKAVKALNEKKAKTV